MFVPSILKICPTDEGTGIYVEWSVSIIHFKIKEY